MRLCCIFVHISRNLINAEVESKFKQKTKENQTVAAAAATAPLSGLIRSVALIYGADALLCWNE